MVTQKQILRIAAEPGPWPSFALVSAGALFLLLTLSFAALDANSDVRQLSLILFFLCHTLTLRHQ